MFDTALMGSDHEKSEYLQHILISVATGRGEDKYESEYVDLRRHFLSHQECKNLLPEFVRRNRDLSQFWTFIQQKKGYAARKAFIWDEFSKLLKYLEQMEKNPVSDRLSSKTPQEFGANTIREQIQKGLERIGNDPDGALTIARTILESTCKFIADERGVEYAEDIKLPLLYKKIARELNLSPDRRYEKIFKQILSGCSGIVTGLGRLRTKLGDAHGQGVEPVKPVSRHAELAVCLAGSMAIFLLKTHEAEQHKT